MFDSIDANGIGFQPKTGNRKWLFVYFILLLILCNFLLLNFFVGVSMEIFSKEKAKRGGYFLLSISQRKWCDVQVGIVQMNAKPKFARPSGELRKKIYFFMQKKSFK